MLRTSTDQYNFPYSKFARFRSNSIYTFSKRVSYNSINTNINNSINNSNNNQEKDNKILFEDLKINNSNIKKTHIKNSNELLRTKNKINKNKNNLNISPILYEPQNQINSIFNENNNRSNSDLIFQFIDASSNKRNALPDTDYLLANYSCNNIYKRKIN